MRVWDAELFSYNNHTFLGNGVQTDRGHFAPFFWHTFWAMVGYTLLRASSYEARNRLCLCGYLQYFQGLTKWWCGREDLNLHGF